MSSEHAFLPYILYVPSTRIHFWFRLDEIDLIGFQQGSFFTGFALSVDSRVIVRLLVGLLASNQLGYVRWILVSTIVLYRHCRYFRCRHCHCRYSL